MSKVPLFRQGNQLLMTKVLRVRAKLQKGYGSKQGWKKSQNLTGQTHPDRCLGEVVDYKNPGGFTSDRTRELSVAKPPLWGAVIIAPSTLTICSDQGTKWHPGQDFRAAV